MRGFQHDVQLALYRDYGDDTPFSSEFAKDRRQGVATCILFESKRQQIYKDHKATLAWIVVFNELFVQPPVEEAILCHYT